MVTRLKICGLKRAEDVAAAVAAGADAVGFCFYPPSPRYVTVETAARLADCVPLWVERVGLFVDVPAAQVAEIARRVGLDGVQLHGNVTPDDCVALRPWRVIRAIPAVAGETLARLEPVLGLVDAVLLDAAVEGRHGGTGVRADWEEAGRVRKALGDLPLILAGGLTAETVGEAIRLVRPYAVDVASGVESAPGVKDPERIRAFAAAVCLAGEVDGADLA